MKKDTRRRTYSDQPINPGMGEGRWQDSLRRMRERISKGLELSYYDDTTIGCKSTEASWGMCTRSLDQWPDENDHIYPEDFKERGRSAPRRSPGACPMRKNGEDSRWGCFYQCRIFQGPKPDRETALKLYDDTIAYREKKFGKLTTKDDHEPWRNDE